MHGELSREISNPNEFVQFKRNWGGDGGVALPGLQVSGGSAKEAVRVAASPRTVGASGAASGRGHPAAGFGPGFAASRTTTLRRDSIRRCSLT